MNDDSEVMKTPYPERNRVQEKPGELPMVLPDEAMEARIAVADMYKVPNRAQIMERWRPRLYDPVHFEPTHWAVGEEFVQVADALDLNAIGTVVDETMSNHWKPERHTPTQFLAKHKDYYQVAPSDGWMQPVVRSKELLWRAPRSKARELLLATLRVGGITVDAAARWAAYSGLTVGRSPTG